MMTMNAVFRAIEGYPPEPVRNQVTPNRKIVEAAKVASGPFIVVEPREVYGNLTFYPVCKKALTLAKIAGTKTLTRRALYDVLELGFEIHVSGRDHAVIRTRGDINMALPSPNLVKYQE